MQTAAQVLINERDSLIKKLDAVSDRDKVGILAELSRLYGFQDPDSAFYYMKQSLNLARSISDEGVIASAYSSMGIGLMGLGNLDSAAWYILEAKRMHEELKMQDKLVSDLNYLAIIYKTARNFDASLDYGQSALAILRSGVVPDYLQVHASSEPITRNIIAWTYVESGMADSAAFMMDTIRQKDYAKHFELPFPHIVLADIAYQKNQLPLAFEEYRKGMLAAKLSGAFTDSMLCQNGIARVHLRQGNMDSAIYYAMQPIYRYKPIYFPGEFVNSYEVLTEAYKRKDVTDSALKYAELMAAEREKLYGSDKSIQLVGLAAREIEEKRKIEEARNAAIRNVRTYALLAGLAVMSVIGLILYRSNLARKKTNDLLARKNMELEVAKQQVDNALTELKQAQSQLIQSEKMASLGELTAGIAHEIQNPLNFVNNFSEINIELADEMTTRC